MVVLGNTTVLALVKGVEPQKVCSCRAGRGRALGCPRQGCQVVPGEPKRALSRVGHQVNKDILVSNEPGRLEVGDRKGAVAVVTRNERMLGGRRERGASDHGREAWGEPHTPHAALAGIAGAPVERSADGNKLAEAGVSAAEGVGNEAKIMQAVERGKAKTDAVAVAFPQGILQGREEPPGARERGRHGAQFAEELLPFRNGNEPSRWWVGVEERV